jgi:hypothetical protein
LGIFARSDIRGCLWHSTAATHGHDKSRTLAMTMA